MKRTIILSLSAWLLAAFSVSAEETDSLQSAWERVYVGAQAGVPIAEADFSSFAADKYRPAWSMGIHTGYRFTDVWSLELSATWGQLFLAEQDCCQQYGFVLGSDLKRYLPGRFPADMEGITYADLLSRTFVQRYGLQANMNILGFFGLTRKSPWRFELSPVLYAVGTSADLVDKTGKASFAENISSWHLGYGAQLNVSYALTERMRVGLYGGFTQLTGKQMDGMPRVHSTNYIADGGVKFTLSLGKAKKDDSSVLPIVPSPAPVLEEPVDTLHAVVPVDADTLPAPPADTLVAEPVLPAEQPVAPIEEVTAPEVSPFPVIYFSFNSVWIEVSERDKVKQMAEMMKADKSIRIRVTGWGDPIGGEAVNQRVSLQRAEAVKRVLGQWLIPADRVETVGAGIKHDATSHAEARGATTIEIINE